MIDKLLAISIGIVFAFIPPMVAGIFVGFVFQDVWVGIMVGVVLFGLSLDMVFRGSH